MEHYRKNFVKIFIGQTMSLLTSAIVQYAIIWYITFKTGSAMDLAIATIAGILPQILLGPFAGVIVDRFDRKKIMILSDSSIAITTLILGIFFMIGEPSLLGMCIVLAIRSLGTTFHTPSFQASIPLLAPKEKMVQIAGINQTINSATLIIAPLLAGVLFGIMPIQYIIFLDIIGALFGVISIMLVKIPSPEIEETEKKHLFLEMKEGFDEIRKSKYLAILTIFVTIISILFMPIGSMYPLITSNYFGLGPIHISIVEVAFSIGMLIGGIVISTWGGFKKKQYTIIIAMLLFAVFLLLSGFVPTNLFWIFVVLTFLMGVMGPFFNSIYIAVLQLKIAPEKLGRVFSITMSLMTIATPIGLLVTAPIAEKIGVPNLFRISGLLMIITCIITMNLKTIKEEE